MVATVIEQINQSDLPPGTRSHALALLALCHHDNGHVAVSWDTLQSALRVSNPGTVRRHLGRMQAAELIHYSSNGDGIVYVNFKAWNGAARAWDLPKPRVGATETVDPTRGHTDPAADHPRVGDTETVDPTRGRALDLPKPRVGATETVDPTRGQPPHMVGCLVVDPIPSGNINQPTNHAPQPAETPDLADEARSLALLLDVGVGIRKAKPLARSASFDEIRRQVAAWWPDFQAGRHQHGLLITRIEQSWGAPPPGREWFETEIGRRHRTPAELAAEQEEEAAAAELLRAVRHRPPDVDAQSPYLDDDPAWSVLAADPGAVELLEMLAGLAAIDQVDDVPLYRIAARTVANMSWLSSRGATALRRKLAVIVGRPVLVEIVPPLTAAQEVAA